MKTAHLVSMLGLAVGISFPMMTLAGLVSINGTVSQSTIPAPYTSQCVESFPFVLYEGQSFKAYETQTPDTLKSSREMLDGTNVRIYNGYNALGNLVTSNTLNGQLPAFTYKSNGRPGTTHFTFGGISTLLVYKQDTATYTVKPSPVPSRSTIGGQIVHNLWRRQILGR